jgi:predicted AAA+ superfamily ATPase
MFPRELEAPSSSFFLFGPRGTGKSTWLKARFPEAETFDLLDEALYQSYLADVSLFALALRAIEPRAWVIVDEVQRLPALLNEVHRAMEERKLRFALTGSSARKLRRGGVNLLAGRAVRREMFPFTPGELGADFDLEKALRYGTLPLIWDRDDREDGLAAYVHMYLKEEVQAEALTRNLPGFARFLPVAALFHGQSVNVAALSRDAGVARTTVSGYLEILEDTLVAYRLPAFEGRLRVREKRHPKLYWIDAGMARAVKGLRGPLDADERGTLLEGYTSMLLRAYRQLYGRSWEVFYWAPGEAKATEVDFLIVSGKSSFAIEVKAAKRLREDHFRGLRAVSELPGLKRRILVYLGETPLRTDDGIEVLPFEDFAGALAAGRI